MFNRTYPTTRPQRRWKHVCNLGKHLFIVIDSPVSPASPTTAGAPSVAGASAMAGERAASVLYWWLYRLHPALIKPFNNTWVRMIRTHRIEQ